MSIAHSAPAARLVRMMSSCAVLFALMFVPYSLHAAVGAADPAAVVVQITGAVKVQRAGAAAANATVGMALMPGDKLLVPQGGKAVMLYRTGKMETATATVTIADSKAAQSAGLFSRTVQTLTVVATTDARQHPNRQGMIRPIAGAAVPIAPRNQIRILGTHPTLTWYRIAEAPGYVVQIRRVDEACAASAVQARPVACRPVRFQAGADTSFTLPANSAALTRGATYEWAIGPTAGGRVSEPQRFRVASEHDVAQLYDRLSEIKNAGIDPAADGLFLSALAYRDIGLFYDARRALEGLAAAGSSKALHQLRAEVFDALGDLEGAAREFAAADAQADR